LTHRARSWLLPAPLAAAAVVLGGIGGFFLGFVAVLLWIDRLLDRLLGGSGTSRIEAERAFRRLSRHRGADLAYLPMETGPAALAARRSLGVQTIAIASIVGTVDRHKAVSFDRWFRPAAWSRGRWTLMYLAAQRGTALPPISVYRFRDRHYLRDGHHRVSVARALGAAEIEAEVVELR
jgi:hypothetical protein